MTLSKPVTGLVAMKCPNYKAGINIEIGVGKLQPELYILDKIVTPSLKACSKKEYCRIRP